VHREVPFHEREVAKGNDSTKIREAEQTSGMRDRREWLPPARGVVEHHLR
jgi:hypothetical protein